MLLTVMFAGPLAHRHVLAGALHHASCGPLAWHALGALCLPFLIRLVQCLLVFQQTRAQSQLFNAAKYACSLPALVLTAIEHEHHVHHTAFPLQRLWLGVMVVSSVFSYYWDVRHDWAMNIWQPGGVLQCPPFCSCSCRRALVAVLLTAIRYSSSN